MKTRKEKEKKRKLEMFKAKMKEVLEKANNGDTDDLKKMLKKMHDCEDPNFTLTGLSIDMLNLIIDCLECTPSEFAEIYRSACLDEISIERAKSIIRAIVFGDIHVNILELQGNLCSMFYYYDIAMVMHDYNFMIPQDLLSDGFLINILTGFKIFGYLEYEGPSKDIIYKIGDDVIYRINRDPATSKIILNKKIIINAADPLFDPIDEVEAKKEGLTDSQISQIKRSISLHKEYQKKYNYAFA